MTLPAMPGWKPIWFSHGRYVNSRKRLSKILASADIYVTAGPHETFGLSIIEAQASGLPVVGVQAGALTERVTEATGILGPVDSPADMAMNLLELSEQLSYRLNADAIRPGVQLLVR